jgi:hypothetical protein
MNPTHSVVHLSATGSQGNTAASLPQLWTNQVWNKWPGIFFTHLFFVKIFLGPSLYFPFKNILSQNFLIEYPFYSLMCTNTT